jgi:hypothetical protein
MNGEEYALTFPVPKFPMRRAPSSRSSHADRPAPGGLLPLLQLDNRSDPGQMRVPPLFSVQGDRGTAERGGTPQSGVFSQFIPRYLRENLSDRAAIRRAGLLRSPLWDLDSCVVLGVPSSTRNKGG